ncbi:L-rhamnose mutarotase [Sediminibacterium soli]|uniref:L-rhamnose mutarotase n=1 Tax=Sediminibacterium soli TaxID=2698829 RepID=UPI00137ABCCB|nr:L-rhamnose mutarotase [Sediminibacterium soli]NCI46916.1 L-rhamnose mutarotase [Sediminibacterium soli]
MRRYCFALDLVNDAALMAEYRRWHEQVWPGILESIHASGIEHMQIYQAGNRLFMIMEVNDAFSFEKKALADAASQEVQEWEKLMWRFQQALPFAQPGEKWVLMEKIFETNRPAQGGQ